MEISGGEEETESGGDRQAETAGGAHLRYSPESVFICAVHRYLAAMAVRWESEERKEVAVALGKFPVASGRCAALARVVHGVGIRRDSATKGRQVTPRGAARFVIPKHPNPPTWRSHTFVETHAHAVDALTGVDGCNAQEYLNTHWEYGEFLQVDDVDVSAVDVGIQDAP